MNLRRRYVPSGDRNLLASSSNLATMLEEVGDLSGAAIVREEIMEVRRITQGIDHLDTLNATQQLGEIFRKKGEMGKASILYERVFTARSHILGREHPDTAETALCLAVTLFALGDYEKARSVSEVFVNVRLYSGQLDETEMILFGVLLKTAWRLFDQGQRHLWDSLVKIENCDDNLLEIYFKQASFREEFMSICETTLGMDHPFTQQMIRGFADMARESRSAETAGAP